MNFELVCIIIMTITKKGTNVFYLTDPGINITVGLIK